MTHNIIKTENYLLVVDDSEIKEGDWIYKSNSNTLNIAGKGYHNFTQSDAKIIAHLPLNNSPVLEFVPLLPLLEDEAESLSLKFVNKRGYTTDDYQDGFEDGYNKAKEKYKFTEEDLRKAIDKTILVCNKELKESYGELIIDEDEIIQSLQQQKMPVAFECESTQYTVDEMSKLPLGTVNQKPKTTTNLQGQTVLIGKYIY